MSLLDEMSASLQLPSSFVRGIAATASKQYKDYRIPKKNGGYREVAQPSKMLKALQRWLLHTYILRCPVHNAAAAYKKGANIRDNALRHVGKKYLLHLDFERFFPSISAGDVSTFAERNVGVFDGWTDTDRWLFCEIVCRYGSLMIGSPTSPALSNAICYDMDTAIDGACHSHGIVYSRYADDMFFSTDSPDRLGAMESDMHRLIGDLVMPRSLALNRSKTVHTSRKHRMQVTGLVLTTDGRVSLGRQRKRLIRGLIYRRDTLGAVERASLAGTVAYLRDVDRDFYNSLIQKYGHDVVMDAMADSPVDGIRPA